VYPFVETITGILFLLLFLRFGLTLPLLIYGFFGACMIVLIFIDYFHKLLPAKITIPGVILGFLSSFVNPLVHPRDSLIGILLGALTLFSVYIAFKLIRNKEALGHGDIVMLAMVGAFLGWQQVLLVLFISSLLGSLVGVVFIVILRKGFDYMLPYGTFIGIAALPAIFWGQKILNYYFLV